jgi:hypothetical protein
LIIILIFFVIIQVSLIFIVIYKIYVSIYFTLIHNSLILAPNLSITIPMSSVFALISSYLLLLIESFLLFCRLYIQLLQFTSHLISTNFGLEYRLYQSYFFCFLISNFLLLIDKVAEDFFNQYYPILLLFPFLNKHEQKNSYLHETIHLRVKQI